METGTEPVTSAVIQVGGHQYRVSPGQVVTVDRLKAEKGQVVEVTTVLAVRQEGRMMVGSPYLPGARVSLRVLDHRLGPKLRVVKFKPKRRYLRVQGHRQFVTQVKVEEIRLTSPEKGGTADGS